MMTYRRIGLIAAIIAASCTPPTPVRTEHTSPLNTLSAAERNAGWRLLFDGKTFDGWRGLGYDSVPTAHWKIENGSIRKPAHGQAPRLPAGPAPPAGGLLP